MATKQKKSAAAKRPVKKLAPCDVIIFDIDNVLVDTRRSYLEAISETINIFLQDGKIPLYAPPGKGEKVTVVEEDDIHHFKLLGGFNDDWDCCYGLLVYLLSLDVKKRTFAELKKSKNIPKFVKSVKERPLGVNGITKILKRHESITIEKIGRIFQEVYLGRDLFEAVESDEAFYWKRKGLIEREKLIFRKTLLEKFCSMGIELGITTGRPRFEALYALKQFDIHPLFKAMTTLDDVKRAEATAKQALRKPHPYSLIETAKKIGEKKNFIYIGDLPDDVVTANSAKDSIAVHSVAFPTYGAQTKDSLAEFQAVEPDFIIKKPSDILGIIEK